VAVDGYLRSHSWEDEGKRRTALEVVARGVQFLDGPRNEEVTPFEEAAATT
jgi:single-stranded DNA-binding protein